MLLIDIGNTRLKWATCRDGAWSPQQAGLHQTVANKHELFQQLWHDLPRPAAIWAANVAGKKIVEEFNDWAQQHWQLNVNWVQSTKQHAGIRNHYDIPEQLGIDRWLAVIAARQWQTTGQLCVIDCGTAITVDVLTQDNHYVGGLIAPGNLTMQQILLKQTDALAQLFQQPTASPRLLATNTTDGIQWGCLYATVGLIHYIAAQLRQQTETKVILTGGGAEELLPLLPNDINYVPELVLLGLAAVANSQAQHSIV